MFLSSSLQTHQSHNTGQDRSKALTTFQPVIHSMGRFTYPLRLNSQGTLVFTIREKRAAAPRELYNQLWYTHTDSYFCDKQTVENTLLLLMTTCTSVFVCRPSRLIYPGAVTLIIATITFPPGFGQFMAGEVRLNQS